MSTRELLTVGHAGTAVRRPLLLTGATLRPFCDKQHIREVITGAGPRIERCFEGGLADDPNLSGRVLSRFKIMHDGAVSGSSIEESTLDNRKVETCIDEVIQSLEFDEPDGGICVINYPFAFNERE